MGISWRQQASLYHSQKRQFFLAKARGTPTYEKYYFSGKEKLLHFARSLGIVLFLAFFFYRSLWAAVFLCPVGIYAYLSFQKEQGEKRRKKLEVEFKDCIMSVAANLRAGYSVDNAFAECVQDIVPLYGKKSLMLGELYRIKKGLCNNMPLEKLLQELGRRSGCASIREFGEVFTIARQSGGNLPKVLQATANLIGERIAVQQEIQTIISGRLLEQRVMNIMPFLLVGYIEAGNKGFFDVLYHNALGIGVMTVCLAIYLTAYCLSRRICKRIL
ncbi:MAG: type II secretion system protein F [Lachnospiraceae bacterium]|nr:type II secretion system protein F [Lachnospiraceae bacterium]